MRDALGTRAGTAGKGPAARASSSPSPERTGPPTPEAFHWPPRPHHGLDDLSDPVTTLVASRAVDLVRAAGSDALNKTLGETLVQVGGGVG